MTLAAGVDVVPMSAHQQLLAEVQRLAQRVAELEARKESLAREFWTPKEVGRRFAIAERLVYQACEEGSLVADIRPAPGGRRRYCIAPDDARRWYRHHVARSNQ